MGIFYCDLVSGNDSNDGLTTSTPKLTLNGVTALVTGATDECRVRGTDALYTSVGDWVWTKYSLSIVYIGADKRADVPAGTYVYQAVTGTTNPRIYKVASVAYAGGNTTATLVGTLNRHGNIEPSGTFTTYKINTVTIAAQVLNKNGYVTGTATDYTGRVMSKITGGWDSSYTSQTTKTLCVGTAGQWLYGTARAYWEISNFVVLGYSSMVGTHTYLNLINNVFAYSVGQMMGGSSAAYWYLNDCFINYNSTGHQWNNLGRYRFDDCVVMSIGSAGSDMFDNGYGTNYFNNTVIGFGNGRNLFDGVGGGTLDGCTYYFKDYALLAGSSDIMKCTNCRFIYCGETNDRNYVFSTALCTSLFNSGSLSNCYFNFNDGTGVGGGFNSGTWIKDTLTGNWKSPMDKFSGATMSAYPSSDILVVETTEFTRLVGGSVSNNGNSLATYMTPSGNTKINAYGYTKLTDDVYTGKPNYSGTSAIKHFVGTNSANCIFQNVDFKINSASGYTLSFYSKASASYTLEYNIKNAGEYIWGSWKTLSVNSSTWTQATESIIASDWKMSGTATLWIRIASQPKDTYAIIDYIQLI